MSPHKLFEFSCRATIYVPALNLISFLTDVKCPTIKAMGKNKRTRPIKRKAFANLLFVNLRITPIRRNMPVGTSVKYNVAQRLLCMSEKIAAYEQGFMQVGLEIRLTGPLMIENILLKLRINDRRCLSSQN
jgi:hypothetical protein